MGWSRTAWQASWPAFKLANWKNTRQTRANLKPSKLKIFRLGGLDRRPGRTSPHQSRSSLFAIEWLIGWTFGRPGQTWNLLNSIFRPGGLDRRLGLRSSPPTRRLRVDDFKHVLACYKNCQTHRCRNLKICVKLNFPFLPHIFVTFFHQSKMISHPSFARLPDFWVLDWLQDRINRPEKKTTRLLCL